MNIEEDNLKKKSIGQLYYNLAVETLNGKSQKLSDYIKSSDYDYTYLKFWASFCSPSMKEFKFLKENIDKYKHIRIISISIDDNEQSWIKSAKKNNIPGINLLSKDDARKTYSFSSIPYGVLLDKNGIIKEIYVDVESLSNYPSRWRTNLSCATNISPQIYKKDIPNN